MFLRIKRTHENEGLILESIFIYSWEPAIDAVLAGQ